MRAILIDDELKGRNLLAELLKKYAPEIEVAASAASADEGLQLIRVLHPDVVFLDIQMPQKDGFQLLEELGEFSFRLVFVTAHHEHAIRAFKYHAFDYLLKPINPTELRKTTNRLLKDKFPAAGKKQVDMLLNQVNSRQLPAKFTVSTQEGLVIIQISDLLYVEADGAYCHFLLRSGERITSSKTLNQFEELLEEHRFFRIHNSFLVNMQEIKKYLKGDGGSVLMSNGKELLVSRRRKEEFLKMLATL